MSEPSFRRTVARMPRDSRTLAKEVTAALPERRKPVSSTSLTGIRLTCMGMVCSRVRRWRLSTRASRSAKAGESFFPAMSVYSKEMRRPVRAKYTRQASSSSSTPQRLLMGMMAERVSSSGAWSDTESVMGSSSWESCRMRSTRPQVESEM